MELDPNKDFWKLTTHPKKEGLKKLRSSELMGLGAMFAFDHKAGNRAAGPEQIEWEPAVEPGDVLLADNCSRRVIGSTPCRCVTASRLRLSGVLHSLEKAFVVAECN